MSNPLAIAMLTEALRSELARIAGRSVDGAQAVAGRPQQPNPNQALGPEIRLFLYQVVPNPSHRNDDLPTRSSGGARRAVPCAAIDLHYLLVFYGNDLEHEPQRLLGSVLAFMQAQPLLQPDRIAAVLDGLINHDADHPLARADLAQRVEAIRFTPINHNLEELSKLWSVFFQTPYVLSAAFEASVLFIEPEDLDAEPALPVRRAMGASVPLRNPQVTRIRGIDPEAPNRAPHPDVVPGTVVSVEGSQLAAERVRIRIAGTLRPPGSVSDERITFSFAPEALGPDAYRAGVVAAQVVHEVSLGDPPRPHRGAESNVMPFVVQPMLVPAAPPEVLAADADHPRRIRVPVDPPVHPGQRVVMKLYATDSDESWALEAPDREVRSSAPEIPVMDVPAGDYLLSLQVDGASTALELEDDPTSPDFGRYADPRISL